MKALLDLFQSRSFQTAACCLLPSSQRSMLLLLLLPEIMLL
jgi:hypothetical protein